VLALGKGGCGTGFRYPGCSPTRPAPFTHYQEALFCRGVRETPGWTAGKTTAVQCSCVNALCCARPCLPWQLGQHNLGCSLGATAAMHLSVEPDCGAAVAVVSCHHGAVCLQLAAVAAGAACPWQPHAAHPAAYPPAKTSTSGTRPASSRANMMLHTHGPNTHTSFDSNLVQKSTDCHEAEGAQHHLLCTAVHTLSEAWLTCTAWQLSRGAALSPQTCRRSGCQAHTVHTTAWGSSMSHVQVICRWCSGVALRCHVDDLSIGNQGHSYQTLAD
jgi:hypothetical protein